MTDLSQTALEFCRECLGWEEIVAWTPPDHPHPVIRCVDTDQQGRRRTQFFDPHDLNAVMESVRGWSQSNRTLLFIQNAHGSVDWGVGVSRYDNTYALAVHADLCHALLAACVEANRKLKG